MQLARLNELKNVLCSQTHFYFGIKQEVLFEGWIPSGPWASLQYILLCCMVFILAVGRVRVLILFVLDSLISFHILFCLNAGICSSLSFQSVAYRSYQAIPKEFNWRVSVLTIRIGLVALN
jgi:hypothetical protein